MRFLLYHTITECSIPPVAMTAQDQVLLLHKNGAKSIFEQKECILHHSLEPGYISQVVDRIWYVFTAIRWSSISDSSLLLFSTQLSDMLRLPATGMVLTLLLYKTHSGLHHPQVYYLTHTSSTEPTSYNQQAGEANKQLL